MVALVTASEVRVSQERERTAMLGRAGSLAQTPTPLNTQPSNNAQFLLGVKAMVPSSRCANYIGTVRASDSEIPNGSLRNRKGAAPEAPFRPLIHTTD